MKFFEPTVMAMLAARSARQQQQTAGDALHTATRRSTHPSAASAASAISAAGIAPARICRVSTEAMPRKMNTPSPPPPMAAAMVAVPMVVTVAMRMPARMVRAASGNLHLPEHLPRRHPHRHRRFAHRRIDAQNARQRVAQNRQQRVEHQRHDRRALADAADERNRNQKPEQRQAGHGLHDVGETQHRAPPARPPRGRDTGRHGQRDRDRHGDEHQRQMLQDAVRAVHRPSFGSLIEHGQECLGFRRAGRRNSSGVATSSSVPLCSRPMRVASISASRTSCVTKIEVLRDLAAQGQKLSLQFQARHRIERAERLVEKQDGGIGRQRARHAHALPLAAGKLAADIARRIARGSRPTCFSSSSTRARIFGSSQPSRRGTRPTFRSTVKCGNRPTSWMT